MDALRWSARRPVEKNRVNMKKMHVAISSMAVALLCVAATGGPANALAQQIRSNVDCHAFVQGQLVKTGNIKVSVASSGATTLKFDGVTAYSWTNGTSSTFITSYHNASTIKLTAASNIGTFTVSCVFL